MITVVIRDEDGCERDPWTGAFVRRVPGCSVDHDLADRLRRCDWAWRQGHPVIDDAEYDRLKRKLAAVPAVGAL